MSGEKAAATPCNKFQANIFNKSKCQNCFKSRELHLLNDHDLEQAKPIYAGWLCLAPEGTDFNNPMQRSRRWQRRFFILYEDGSLSFALDELPSTLPQGTVNVNVCTDIYDAESRTGQKNALCIATPEQEVFIRGDNKDIINGWSEQLAVYLRTNKQNQKKKRKVEPVANQELSPAKMVATDPSFPSSGRDHAEPGHWQEDQRDGGPDATPIWTVADGEPPGPERTPAGNASSYLCLDPSGSLTSDGTAGFGGSDSSVGSLDLAASESSDTGRNNRLAEPNDTQTSANNKNQTQDGSKDGSAERPLGSEATGKEQEAGVSMRRTGRSEARANKREKLQSCGDSSSLAAPPPQRRAKSLDRRTSDTAMTPDLLNFKKGWMVKLDENDQWKKYWFVLSTDSLRYYKDSTAEEASDLEGEINLTKCYNVSEYQVQRNYGFQIHTPKGAFTLSAMTAGIRKNWIQALMKNVHPANAPDVASLSGQHASCSPPEVLPKPDVTQDSPSESDPHPKASSVTERRCEGRYKTFDWAEFNLPSETPVDADPQKSPCSLELGDLERRKRREERRRRYEKMLGFSLLEKDGSVRALSPKSQQRMEEEMEECWKQVETTMFRVERTVPLFSDGRDAEEMEKVLQSYSKAVDDLKAQLEESERRRLELEAQLSAERFQHQQLDSPISPEADFYPSDMKEKPLKDPTKSLKEVYRELLQQQNIIRQNMREQLGQETSSPTPQLPSIWLHDARGELQELEDLLSETAASPLLSPASDSQHSQSEGISFDDRTADLQDQLDADARQLFPASESHMDKIGSWARDPAEGDESSLKQVSKLSQEVELLKSQNEALNQRNQEMLNQLTEADREIERLKAELSSRYSEPCDLPEVELQGKTRVEDLEMELNLKNQELQEAQTLIGSLEENLRETEVLLQLSDPIGEDEKKKRAEKPEGYLLRCFEATEAKLTELERQLDQSELTCRELQEAEKLSRRRAAEAEADIGRLNKELEKERMNGDRRVSAEEKTQKVIEGMVVRLRALGRFLEAIDRLDKRGEVEGGEGSPAVVSQLEWEEAFWSLLLNKLKEDPSKLVEPADAQVSEAAEHMMLETRILLVGHRLLQTEQAVQEGGEGRREGEDNVIVLETTKTEDESSMFDLSDFEHFKTVTQIKISLLDQLTASLSAAATVAAHNELQPTANRLYHFHSSDDPWIASFIHSAATEALYRCRLRWLWSTYANCSKCTELREENEELKGKLSNLEQQRVAKMNAGCQTDEIYPQDAELQSAEESEEEEEEELIDEMEIPQNVSDESLEESDEPDGNVELISALRRKVEELEEQLTVSEDKMSSVQLQYEKETEKLKVACERGLASMEESHLKVLEELQRRHKQEVERLLVERDRLLEEESTATAIAIEAIKNAHRLELQREVQRRCEFENGNGLSHLEDVHRQHSEELASCQRELEVLSRQFSLKCLENGHLVQALDAERKALCQCQQENQDLRTRNQELSGHLAAEITRLCTLAKQDALPLSQGMDVYEMEITLRVKESEVQCLKQEITSLKDELQSAQRDKRNVTKKYKDMYTELSIVRAKAEREADELRENLRLAHRALGRTSP